MAVIISRIIRRRLVNPLRILTRSTPRIGGLCLAPLAFTQTQNMAPEHDHATHQHTDICAGFMILPNGYAVLSAMDPGSTSGMQHGMHHDADHGQAGKHDSGVADQKSMGDQPHAQQSGNMKHADYLMGYLHALSSDYTSEWTQTPPGLPDPLASK